jgi:hypothetical protein
VSPGSGRLSLVVLAGLALGGCDLPPGIRTAAPGGGTVPVGTAEVTPPPTEEPWTTDFLAWQPGGETACTVPPPPVGGGPPAPAPAPFVVEIWDGVADACADVPGSGARSIRLSMSDLVAGTFTVAPTCSGPLSAGGVFRRFQGSQETRRLAIDGSVTVTGITGAPTAQVVEGVFSVRFDGDTASTSGGFRAEVGCVSSGR